jgi:ATP-dependent helicase YprA (DUF1998 family)
MNALAILNDVFGYPRFRGNQGDIVAHVAGGGDALVLMPTGGGKSLCYQIPALMRPGCGVVVSPLIALMADQVAALDEAGVRAALTKGLRAFGELIGQKKAAQISAEDIFNEAELMLSVFILPPIQIYRGLTNILHDCLQVCLDYQCASIVALLHSKVVDINKQV